MTPLSIYRLWLGPADMPARYVQYGYEWAKLNPGWVVVDLFGQGVGAKPVEIPSPPNYLRQEFHPTALVNFKVFEELALGAISPIDTMDPGVAICTQRADVAGYEIVYTFGGLYVNCDMHPLNPLCRLPVPMGQAMVAREDPAFLSNAAMASPAGHPFFGYVIEELGKRFWDMRWKPMNKVTGPYLLTDCYKSWALVDDRPGVFVPNARVWNYASYNDVPKGGTADAFVTEARQWGAVALHDWGHRGQQQP